MSQPARIKAGSDPAERALRASAWEKNPRAPIPGGRSPNKRPRRENRHGRELRGFVIPPTLPGYRTRRERFDGLVLAVVERLEYAWARQLDGTEFPVEAVPPPHPPRGVPAGLRSG